MRMKRIGIANEADSRVSDADSRANEAHLRTNGAHSRVNEILASGKRVSP